VAAAGKRRDGWSASLSCMATRIGEDFRGPDGRLGYLLRQAQHALRIALDDALRPLQLTGAQFAVLRLVEVEPGESGATLAFDSMLTPQTTHEILIILEKAGLITREYDPHDRRIRPVFLTRAGEKLLVAAHREAIALEERMVEGLTDTQRRDFRSWLVNAAAALSPK
jgi:DNA-binding MarR family transcriptional regulator